MTPRHDIWRGITRGGGGKVRGWGPSPPLLPQPLPRVCAVLESFLTRMVSDSSTAVALGTSAASLATAPTTVCFAGPELSSDPVAHIVGLCRTHACAALNTPGDALLLFGVGAGAQVNAKDGVPLTRRTRDLLQQHVGTLMAAMRPQVDPQDYALKCLPIAGTGDAGGTSVALRPAEGMGIHPQGGGGGGRRRGACGGGVPRATVRVP